ncbi:MAG: GntR family transcriptional regulator [Erysipelotrichaceae bacterium]|nr:GntR family transcriptional regulator [Erysipelotrichaceae bacterium]
MDKAKKHNRFLYDDVKKAIMEDYRNSPNYTPMPSERELCEIYKVSRPTVRKALEMLENDGVITTVRNKGAFYVGPKRFTQGGLTLGNSGISFFDQVVAQGSVPTSKVLVQTVRPCDINIAARLNINENDLIFVLERLRYIDGELYQINVSHIPYDLCPELVNIDFSNYVSLHKTLNSYGIYPYRARKVIEVKQANRYEAFHLNLNDGDPITVTHHMTYDRDDRMIEYAITKSSVYFTRFEMTIYNE